MRLFTYSAKVLFLLTIFNAIAVADDASLEAVEDGLLMNEYECTQVWDTHSKNDEREAKRICTSFTDDLRSGLEGGWSIDFFNQVMEAQWVFLNDESNVNVSPAVNKVIHAQLVKARKGAPEGPMLQPIAHVKSALDKPVKPTSTVSVPHSATKDLNEMSFDEFAAVMKQGQKKLESTPDGKLYNQLMEERDQKQYQLKPLCKQGGVSANCRQR